MGNCPAFLFKERCYMDESLYDSSLLITTGRIPIVKEIIPEIEIYQHYAPLIRMGLQKSPLRPEVKSASFSLYEANDKISFKDHGSTGTQGDVYDFVQEWYRVHMQKEISMRDINKIIYYDMKLSDRETVNHDLFFNDDETGPRMHRREKRGLFKIQVKDIGWTSWAQGYWIDTYGICPSILSAYKTGHAKEVWVTPPGKETYLWGVSTEQNPIFYFYFPLTQHIKCYRPFEKNHKKKWIMNCDNSTDIQGYYQLKIKQTLPKLIIFTKAMKEIMFYRSFHVDAIAIHGENHYFDPDFIRHIKKYSTYQLGLYDNDKPGRHAAWELRRRSQIPLAIIQEAKNITDLWEQKPHKVLDYINRLKNHYQL